MHHGARVMTDWAGAGWVLPVAILAAIALLAILAWVLAKQGRAEGRASEPVEENLEGQIMAMLHQSGEPLSQLSIAANLDLPVQRVAEVLKDLEDRGRITRQWEADEYTYSVREAQ